MFGSAYSCVSRVTLAAGCRCSELSARCTGKGSAQRRPRRRAYFMALVAEVITPAMAAISLITSVGFTGITSFMPAKAARAGG
jgi:hypothetical protein